MCSGSFKNVINKMCLKTIYLIYMYKKDFALNNLQWLICYKTKPNQTRFNLSKWSDYQSIAFYTLSMFMMTLFSVDEMLLPRYIQWSTNFRVFFLLMRRRYHRHENSVLSEFRQRPMPLTVCFRLCRRYSTLTVVFAEELDHLHDRHQ